MFWNTKTDGAADGGGGGGGGVVLKYVKKLLDIKACAENCVLATRADDDPNQFILVLCNAIGSPLDSKCVYIPCAAPAPRPHELRWRHGVYIPCATRAHAHELLWRPSYLRTYQVH